MPLVLYTLLRVALIAVVYVVLALFGLTGPVWFVVAVVIALLLSYAAFRPVRDRAALWLADRARRRKEAGTRISGSIDADADVEDAAVDEVTERQAQQQETPGRDER